MKTQKLLFIGIALLGTLFLSSCNKEYNCHCDAYVPSYSTTTPVQSYDVPVKNTSKKGAEEDCKITIRDGIVEQSLNVSPEWVKCGLK